MASSNVPKVHLTRCRVCNELYVTEKEAKHKQTANHIRALSTSSQPIQLVETAFKCRLETYFMKNLNEASVDLTEYLENSVLPKIAEKVSDVLKIEKSIKVNIVVYLEYEKPGSVGDKNAEKQLVSFKTENISFFKKTDVAVKVRELLESIMKESAEFATKGSGWTLLKIIGTEFRVNKYVALSNGSSYIPLPFRSNGVINVQNKDNECFKYAVLGKHIPHLTPNKHRVNTYNNVLETYDFSCVSFPTPLREIPKFEKVNNVSISVFGIDGYDDEVYDAEDDADNGEIGLGPEDYIQDSDGIDDPDDPPEDHEDDVVAGEAGEHPPKKKKRKKSNKSTGKVKIYPLKVTGEEKPDHIDLLYFSMGNNSHYCFISDFEKLIRSQLTGHHHRIYICKKCFSHYRSEVALDDHKKLCGKSGGDGFSPVFPKEKVLQFSSPQKSDRHEYLAYCDFESYLSDVEFDPDSPTFAYQHHKPMSYAYIVVSSDPFIQTDSPVLYRGWNAHQHFLTEMIQLSNRVADRIQIGFVLRMSEETEAAFAAATHCALCECEFTENIIKVRDHKHEYVDPNISNYRRALCTSCNLKCKHPKNLTCVFHNLSRYDLHFIVKALNGRNLKAEVVATTDETYISLVIRLQNNLMLRFIDSYRFLASSLDKLVASLPDAAFIRTSKLAETPKQLKMLKQKGVFCYDYVSDSSKLKRKTPPRKKAFFSKLTNETISDANYQRFLDTWKEFGFKNLGEYSDFYLKLDVCLLADVFEEFRTFGQNNYGLDCAKYLTLPSFAFDGFLKMTKVEIELFRDYDQILFIHNNIRGGLTQCNLRHALANDPRLPVEIDEQPDEHTDEHLDNQPDEHLGDHPDEHPAEQHMETTESIEELLETNESAENTADDQSNEDTDESDEYTDGTTDEETTDEETAEESDEDVLKFIPRVPRPTYQESEPLSCIQYLDVTALYAFTMCKPLPYAGYQWVHPDDLKEWTATDILTLQDDGEIGYIFCVDLDYPREIHDEHSDLPFCPENKIPPLNGSRHPKLLATLENKKEYVIHFVALKQAISHGLKLTRIHRALKFKQKPFLKEFIDLNARLRQEAKGNEFAQTLLKLCSNACYGKFLENPLKRKNIKLATSDAQMAKWISKAEFKDRTIFDEELAAVQFYKKKIVFNRPEIVGFAILDLSKVHMYWFHYDVMLVMYPKIPRPMIYLCYMDTDSFIYWITTDDRFKDMAKQLHLYDTSNFPKDHPIWSDQNYKVMGTFKDETGGDPIIEFCGLSPKSYEYRTLSKHDDMRAKGVQRCILKNTITPEDYVTTLYYNQDTYRAMRRIQSKKHDVFSIEVWKKAMSSRDDKRFILPGNVGTLPYGHYAITKRDSLKPQLIEGIKGFNRQSLNHVVRCFEDPSQPAHNSA